MRAPEQTSRGGAAPASPTDPPVAADVVLWSLELARTAPWLWRAYGLFPAVPARVRERALCTYAERRGAPVSAWAHTAWRTFLGPPHGGPVLDDVVDHADRSAATGRPANAELLRLSVAPRAARALRASLAWTALACAAERGLSDLDRRIRSRRVDDPEVLLGDVLAMLTGAPLLASSAAAAAVLDLVNRLAPPVEPVAQADDAGLLAHVLADATPAYLGNALVRLLVVRSPWPFALGVRSGRSVATVRVGRGEVVVTDGLEPDVIAVLDGDVDQLVEAASGALLTELHDAAEQPGG